MTKQRADGKTINARLQRASDLLYDTRADLQTIGESHDIRLTGVITAIQEYMQARIDDHKATVDKTNLQLNLLSQKRDNVEARIRGRSKLHKGIDQSVQQMLSEAKETIQNHEAGLVSLGGESTLDETVAKVLADAIEGIDDLDLADLEDELRDPGDSGEHDEDLVGFAEVDPEELTPVHDPPPPAPRNLTDVAEPRV